MGIQNYFIDKRIEAALKKSDNKNNKALLAEILSVAIFVDEQSAFDEKKFRELQEIINLDETHFSILTFKEKKTSFNEFRGTVLFKNEVSWQGRITPKDVKSFIKKPYDLLIDYTHADSLMRQLVVAKIVAKMKVGYSEKKKKFYDLLISVSPKEIDLFNKELVRYLKILKLLE